MQTKTDFDKLRAFMDHGATAPRMKFEAIREGYGGVPRLAVRDLDADKLIKRFPPPTVLREATRWIADRFPGGVWSETENFGRMWVFRNSVSREKDMEVSAQRVRDGTLKLPA